jgi:hypothetical protein
MLYASRRNCHAAKAGRHANDRCERRADGVVRLTPKSKSLARESKITTSNRR